MSVYVYMCCGSLSLTPLLVLCEYMCSACMYVHLCVCVCVCVCATGPPSLLTHSPSGRFLCVRAVCVCTCLLRVLRPSPLLTHPPSGTMSVYV